MQYRLTDDRALPENLQRELPTAAELSREFPLLSVVKVRIEIERALNELAREHGLSLSVLGIGRLVRELQRQGLLSETANELLRVMDAMNRASHGVDVDTAKTQEAIQVGNRFLAELGAANSIGNGFSVLCGNLRKTHVLLDNCLD